MTSTREHTRQPGSAVLAGFGSGPGPCASGVLDPPGHRRSMPLAAGMGLSWQRHSAFPVDVGSSLGQARAVPCPRGHGVVLCRRKWRGPVVPKIPSPILKRAGAGPGRCWGFDSKTSTCVNRAKSRVQDPMFRLNFYCRGPGLLGQQEPCNGHTSGSPGVLLPCSTTLGSCFNVFSFLSRIPQPMAVLPQQTPACCRLPRQLLHPVNS